MRDRIFSIVDVFAETRYAGNQLAVFQSGSGYSDEVMQILAREMNFSETSFILSDRDRDGGWDVRIFTPAAEVPFAGHPTLGTAFVIQRELIKHPVEQVILNLPVGRIPVRFDYLEGKPDKLWMTQNPPDFGDRHSPKDFAAALGLDPGDIDDRFPIQEVSTGLAFFIIPLKTLDAVKRARVDRERFFALIEKTGAKAPLIFCPQPYREVNDLNVRVFVDYYNIPEDPATGSACGCLAAYLSEYEYFGTDRIDLRVEQGYEIGRPSLILLKARKKGEEIEVCVGGRVIPMAKGSLED
jgi:trans-2,3-dihydro-3-hydroxyanthranilate isomerase